MTTKTYTRARAAKAALVNLLNMHEATHFVVETFEAEEGRFGARVEFENPAEQSLLDDLNEKGFGYAWAADDLDGDDLDGDDLDGYDYLDGDDDLDGDDETFAGDPDLTVIDPIEIEIAEKPKSNYIREVSVIGGACATVWAIADEMEGAARKDVIEACRKAGVAYGTARTQYQAWKKAGK